MFNCHGWLPSEVIEWYSMNIRWWYLRYMPMGYHIQNMHMTPMVISWNIIHSIQSPWYSLSLSITIWLSPAWYCHAHPWSSMHPCTPVSGVGQCPFRGDCFRERKYPLLSWAMFNCDIYQPIANIPLRKKNGALISVATKKQRWGKSTEMKSPR